MGKNIKFHAIAITLICVVITILYVLIGPKPVQQDPVKAANGHLVQIAGATWGENCNTYIEQAMEAQTSEPMTHDEKGDAAAKAVLKPVTSNNVQQKVAEACNGKPVCELYVDASTLGVDPLPTCYKQLVTTYRCFSFDRLNSITVNQGDTLKIDCAKPEPTADAPAQQ